MYLQRNSASMATQIPAPSDGISAGNCEDLFDGVGLGCADLQNQQNRLPQSRDIQCDFTVNAEPVVTAIERQGRIEILHIPREASDFSTAYIGRIGSGKVERSRTAFETSR